ncbi:MAG: 16S rRNA (guanine(966)-N(2))-methyltransferase RsmD [Alphaproteobacteria bacterium]
MRIVSGVYGGRKLNVPKGRDIRPTSDKIRGAVFNMLSSRGAIEDARALDAFCGSGALGLEAISRGAAHVTFFDKSRDSLSLTRENAEMLGADVHSKFEIKDSSNLPCNRGDDTYSLVFLDPPYHNGLIDKALLSFRDGGWLGRDAWIVCESERNFNFKLPQDFTLDNEKIYGEIKITLLRYQPITPV